MQTFKFTYLLPLLVLALFSSCSGDSITGENDSNEATESAIVTFNISTTRGTLKPANNDNELITSYMIVVAENVGGNPGKIVKVLKATSLTAAEMHSVKASISSGSYKVFAFANIPFSAEGDRLYNKFTEGAAMPDITAWYYGDASFRNGMTGAIPMSNSVNGMDLTVLSNKGENTYAIEVVRMLAKVEFEFMNSSSLEDVTISTVAMGPLTTVGTTENGFIPLSWYNDASALTFYSVDDKKFGTETYTHTITNNSGDPSPFTLDAGDVTTKPSTSFYIIESNPDPVTKAFNLAFTVRRGSETEEIRYALLDKSLVASGTNLDGDDDRSPFIRRNDWIRIPIDLGDYEFRLEARSYPPIGGYPEAEIDELSSHEFRVNFKEPGDFSILPFIRKYGTDDWKYLDDTSVIQSYTFTVDTDPAHGFADIFRDGKSPAKKANEIVGSIKSDAHGSALVTITINIHDGAGITRTLTRKMYITH